MPCLAPQKKIHYNHPTANLITQVVNSSENRYSKIGVTFNSLALMINWIPIYLELTVKPFRCNSWNGRPRNREIPASQPLGPLTRRGCSRLGHRAEGQKAAPHPQLLSGPSSEGASGESLGWKCQGQSPWAGSALGEVLSSDLRGQAQEAPDSSLRRCHHEQLAVTLTQLPLVTRGQSGWRKDLQPLGRELLHRGDTAGPRAMCCEEPGGLGSKGRKVLLGTGKRGARQAGS